MFIYSISNACFLTVCMSSWGNNNLSNHRIEFQTYSLECSSNSISNTCFSNVCMSSWENHLCCVSYLKLPFDHVILPSFLQQLILTHHCHLLSLPLLSFGTLGLCYVAMLPFKSLSREVTAAKGQFVLHTVQI